MIVKIADYVYPLQQLDQAQTNHPDFAAHLDFIGRWGRGEERFSINTSGSTGSPKLIQLSRSGMEASANRTKSVLPVEPNRSILVAINPSTIGGLMMMARALIWDVDLVLSIPSRRPLHCISADIGFVSLVPFQLSSYAEWSEEEQRALNQCDVVLLGGSAMPLPIKRLVAGLGCPVWIGYGMTETYSHIALQRVNGDQLQTSFHPLKGIEISKDDRGCAVVSGDGLEAAVVSNDLIDLLPDGTFRYLGRVDGVINSGGIKLIPEEIEAEIGPILEGFYPEFPEYFIGSMPDESLGEALILLVESTDYSRGGLLFVELRNRMGIRAPKRVISVPRFARTESDKVDRLSTLSASGF